MKRIIISLILPALAAVAASAQSMPSLLIPGDPVSASVAGSGIAREATAFAVNDNASAMSLSSGTFAASASYGMWAPEAADSRLVNAGAYCRLGARAALGFSGSYIIDRQMNITGSDGIVTGTFSPKDIVARVGFSYLITDCLSAGVTAKMIYSSIGPDISGTAFGGDISVMYRQGALSAAAAVCNLGTAINYGGASWSMPAYAKAGAAYSVIGLTLSAEADYLFEGAFAAALGAEYGIADIAFLRAGYHYGARDKGLPSFASVGLGVKYAGVELNAACLLASRTLANSLLLGLGYRF